MTVNEQDRRQEIMKAALRVFAAQGVHKASIKTIAKEAGLNSPSLIYWYFKDKDELLRSVIEELSPIVRQTAEPARLLEQPPEEVLPMLMRAYYSTLDHPEGPHLVRLFFSEAVRNPEVAAHYSQGQVGVLRFMVTYLKHQIGVGRLRPHDPEASARMFLGSLFAFTLTKEILPHMNEGLPERETYIHEVVTTFIQGLKRDSHDPR